MNITKTLTGQTKTLSNKSEIFCTGYKLCLDYFEPSVLKKMKFDQSDFRLQCRVSCGADHVVENVWPYSLPPDYVRAL